jgi:putative MATE family efflux protein
MDTSELADDQVTIRRQASGVQVGPAGARPARARDLTSGGLHRNILWLALPMTLEASILNVSQILDTYWVGELGSAALAAVTISVTIRWMMNSLANGLGIGGMAVVARRIGERNQEAAEHATWQTILLGLLVSLVLGAVGMVIARPMLTLLGADAEVLPLGVAYLRVAFGGLFTIILVFVINAMLRGAGSAGWAMAVLGLATAVTVVTEPLLISGVGPIPPLGVAGSALAYVLGFGAGLILQAVVLLSGRASISINLRRLRPDFPLMWKIVRIALPSTVQMTLRSSSRLAIIALVGLYGTFATAGYGVANRLLLVALIPSFGLGNAAGTLVGQNLGAGKGRRAERSAWWVSAYAAGYITVVAVVLFAFARPLMAIFDDTPQVVEVGAECLRIVAPSLILNAVGVVLARAFDGAGNTVPAMVVNLLSLWGLEVPVAYGLSRGLAAFPLGGLGWSGLGSNGVWWGRAAANAVNGLLFALWFRRGRWKKKKV